MGFARTSHLTCVVMNPDGMWNVCLFAMFACSCMYNHMKPKMMELQLEQASVKAGQEPWLEQTGSATR